MRKISKIEAKYILKRTVCGLIIAIIIVAILDSPWMLGYVFPSEARWILGMGGVLGFGWGYYRGVYLKAFGPENAEHWGRIMRISPAWIAVWLIIFIVGFLFSGHWRPPD